MTSAVGIERGVANLRLALIGDHIGPSEAPRLHRLAGRLSGLDVTYELKVPAALGRDFEAVIADCAATGYRGVNVTHPYKERAAMLAAAAEPTVRGLGAVNTVVFEPSGAQAFNTDHSGFVAAYRHARGDAPPGTVCLIGAGGAGRAIAFALAALGADELRLVERDLAKAERLCEALRRAGADLPIRNGTDAAAAAAGAAGLVNASPVGMVGHAGTPLPAAAMAGAVWAFDAVYTPRATRFLADAGAAGLELIPGWELFFHQGIEAWALFSGRPVDASALRRALADDI